ncbi:hypothetical protein [Flexivirga lutea]
MPEWEWQAAALSQLLDVQIYSADGDPVGKVDDVEFRVPNDGGPPVLEALLCGPSAFGPRVGGVIGLAIWSIGRRLSPTGGSPVRIPLSEVQRINRREIRLRETARGLGIHRTTDWARDNIVKAIPGGSR